MACKRTEMVKEIKAIYDQWDHQMIDTIWPARGIHSRPVDGMDVKWHI